MDDRVKEIEGRANEARWIAEKLRHDAKPLAAQSTASIPTVFIPFAEWYDDVANDLSELTTLRSKLREAEKDMRERAAKLVEAKCERVLARQYPDADALSLSDSINLNIRMAAMLLPDLATDIRALPLASAFTGNPPQAADKEPLPRPTEA